MSKAIRFSLFLLSCLVTTSYIGAECCDPCSDSLDTAVIECCCDDYSDGCCQDSTCCDDDQECRRISKAARRGECCEPCNSQVGFTNIYDEDCWYRVAPDTDCQYARRRGLPGIWFPECPPAFRPFVANPRQLTYSVGWRFYDHVIAKNVIDFSFGDVLPVYRWINIWCLGGDLQFDIEGGVWDVFAPFDQNSPMVNADYYVGFPVTYMFGKWAIRLRGYHISCHLGDEFLVNHPHFKRVNPSSEYLDLFASYQLTDDIRLYAGLGWVVAQDKSFVCGDWYAEGGVEVRLPGLGYHDYRNRLYGEPYFGMHFRYQDDFKNHVDSTYVLGYEWGKFSGLRHKFRIFLEYHDGYSLEGQFCKLPTNYLSIRASYGF